MSCKLWHHCINIILFFLSFFGNKFVSIIQLPNIQELRMCNKLRRLKQISFKWTVKPVVCIFAETGPDEGDGKGRQASLYFLNVDRYLPHLNRRSRLKGSSETFLQFLQLAVWQQHLDDSTTWCWDPNWVVSFRR